MTRTKFTLSFIIYRIGDDVTVHPSEYFKDKSRVVVVENNDGNIKQAMKSVIDDDVMGVLLYRYEVGLGNKKI